MSQTAAFFDVDGTLVHATIVHYYRHFALSGRTALGRTWWYGGFLPKILLYLVVDKLDRARFNEMFYRNYAGMEAAPARCAARQLFAQFIRPRLFPEGVAALRSHQQAGHRIVLVTGSLDFIIAPLQEFLGADDSLAVSLVEREGRFTGELTGAPLSEEEKARAVRHYAARHRLDLGACHAYGNDPADIPMLQSVGQPVAVNPRGALARLAARQGWQVRRWAV